MPKRSFPWYRTKDVPAADATKDAPPIPEAEVLAILKRARRRLTDPARWTQGESASAPAGAGIRFLWDGGHPLADRWCAVGALAAETCRVERGAGGWVVLRDAVRFKAAYLRLKRYCLPLGREVEEVNDGDGHQAVLALYDAAIRGK
jgi:hypothetical protein